MDYRRTLFSLFPCFLSCLSYLALSFPPFPSPSQPNNNPPPSSTDHWHDVLVGSIIGTLLAYFSYRQYYPSLSSELSHRPYSPRIKEDLDAVLPFHGTNNSVPVMNQDTISGSASNPAHRRQESATRQPLAAHIERDKDYELEGTVPGPGGPEHLYNVWSEGRKDEVLFPRL